MVSGYDVDVVGRRLSHDSSHAWFIAILSCSGIDTLFLGSWSRPFIPFSRVVWPYTCMPFGTEVDETICSALIVVLGGAGVRVDSF